MAPFSPGTAGSKNASDMKSQCACDGTSAHMQSQTQGAFRHKREGSFQPKPESLRDSASREIGSYFASALDPPRPFTLLGAGHFGPCMQSQAKRAFLHKSEVSFQSKLESLRASAQ